MTNLFRTGVLLAGLMALFMGVGCLIGGGVGMVLAPIAAMLAQMAISRTRAYEADRAGAEISGNPEWLASALRKIEAYAERAAVPDAERHPTGAHLFIVNPLDGASLADLFATHPSTAERVRRLEAMAAARGIGPWGRAAVDTGLWGRGGWSEPPRRPEQSA